MIQCSREKSVDSFLCTHSSQNFIDLGSFSSNLYISFVKKYAFRRENLYIFRGAPDIGARHTVEKHSTRVYTKSNLKDL